MSIAERAQSRQSLWLCAIGVNACNGMVPSFENMRRPLGSPSCPRQDQDAFKRLALLLQQLQQERGLAFLGHRVSNLFNHSRGTTATTYFDELRIFRCRTGELLDACRHSC